MQSKLFKSYTIDLSISVKEAPIPNQINIIVCFLFQKVRYKYNLFKINHNTGQEHV